MKTVKLSEIADLIGGQIMTRVKAEAPTDEVVDEKKVIIPKAIEASGVINSEELAVEKLKSEIDEKKLSQSGDIIIKLNAPYNCGMVYEETVGCAVPSFCAIIRIKKEYDADKLIPEYLLAYLNSSYCRRQIESQAQGSVMAVVSVGKIKNIDIKIPEISTQHAIGMSLQETQTKLGLLKKITELEFIKNDAQIKEMVIDHE